MICIRVHCIEDYINVYAWKKIQRSCKAWSVQKRTVCAM